MGLGLSTSHHRATGFVDVLDKKPVFVGGIEVSPAEVELLTIRIRLLVCSRDKVQEIRLDWRRCDRELYLRSERGDIAGHGFRAHIRRFDKVEALTAPVAPRSRPARLRGCRAWQLNGQRAARASLTCSTVCWTRGS